MIPPPSAIVNAGLDNIESLRRSAQATAVEALGGLVIGTLGGILVAFATARWVTARDVLLPVAIATSAVPIIAVAPILNNWFGVLNPLSQAVESRVRSEQAYMACIRTALLSYARGDPPLTSVEFARRNIEPEDRPSFSELEDLTRRNARAAA